MLRLTLMAAMLMVGEPKAGDGLKIYGRAALGVYRQSVAIRGIEELSLLTPTNGSGKEIEGWVAGQLKVKAIDWDKQMLIVIYGGEQPTGGYAVELKSLEAKGDKLIVHWKLKTPPPDAIVTQAVTHPELMILVDRFKGDVVFDPPPARQ